MRARSIRWLWLVPGLLLAAGFVIRHGPGWVPDAVGPMSTPGPSGPLPAPDPHDPVLTPDPGGPRVALRVLVVTDGTPWVEAIRQELTSEGVAIRVIDLLDPARPEITDAFLSGRLADGTSEGQYQGVVVPGNQAAGLSSDEQTALAVYERAFNVRQVDAFRQPGQDVGTSPPAYAGTLDAAAIAVTSAARSNGFQYLGGSFTFQGTAGGNESYGYLVQPLPDTTTTTFTPFLTATVPGHDVSGVLAGVYTDAGRQRLELSFGFSEQQLQFRYLAHGIITWLTKGVHLGEWRNYLSVHIDDVFNANARWSTDDRCTPGADVCPPGTPKTTQIRMTADDVRYAVQWQREHNFTMDLAYNGGAEKQFQNNGEDPLFEAFKAVAKEFRWINHTTTHAYLGCVQDFTVDPWCCKTDGGQVVWVDSEVINSQIRDNVLWAEANDFPIDKSELLTGEYSGMRILPQQPVDNPNLIDALGPNDVRYVGLDASREPALRPAGAALGVPRHPIDVFYNVTTTAEEIDEYNWRYTSTADGGSGWCEQTRPANCIEPVEPRGGWESRLVPQLVRTALGNVLSNDPRAFYMHQSNLAGDRLAYSVMDGVLSAYRSVFTSTTPVVNARFSMGGEILNRQQIWAQALQTGAVSGYLQGNTLELTGPSGTQVPVTVPDHTQLAAGPFGELYGGERSAYLTLGESTTTLVLAATPYQAAPVAGATPKPGATKPINGFPGTSRPGGKRSNLPAAADPSIRRSEVARWT